MKKILSLVLVVLALANVSHAQTTCNSGLPPQSGEGYWGGVPIEDVISNVQLIFEGRVLSDSAFLANPPGRVCTAHRILVLKEFKGNFISDTIEAFNYGGTVSWQGAPTGEMSYVKIGDEDIFMVSTATNHTYFNLDKPDFYFMMYGRDCGYVNVCNKKEDEVQEMYAKLERHIGHKHTEVHPRVCAGPEDQKGLWGYHQSKSNSSLVGILSAFDITATWLKLVFIFPSSILLIWLNSILARFANSCCEMPFSRRSSRIRAPHFFIKSISQVYFTPKIGIV